eukprot:TRINITY_DN11209_c0_g1_i1.p1 TRINITY_DN11209_c0_g1~~TRINITY_DN11209_c0_g1_i1.p1  ORF type:complete len:366 (-),score=64.43 TRINITY_DN11209_c0_g1_i1:37-1134(-)
MIHHLIFLSLLSVVIVNCALFQREWLNTPTGICNDGSSSGFYFRNGTSKDRWLIYLEGGGFCYDNTSCSLRWKNSEGLMSSKGWSPTRGGSGILSDDPAINPHWHDVNMVYVPYCTSDSYCGAQPKSELGWSFMGSVVVEQIFHRLLSQGLNEATEVVFTGSSAGAEGLWPNADKVAQMLNPKTRFAVLADSGWFLDIAPYRQQDCSELSKCTEAEALRRGFKIWNPKVNEACQAAKTPDTLWECMLGPYAFPYLKSPTFVFAWRFDSAGLGHDGMGFPTTQAELQYAAEAAANLTKSFDVEGAKAVFSASCYDHTIEESNNWNKVTINGINYGDVAYDFVKNSKITRNIDTCSTPNCNPTCKNL